MTARIVNAMLRMDRFISVMFDIGPAYGNQYAEAVTELNYAVMTGVRPRKCARGPNVVIIAGKCIYDDLGTPGGDGCGCLHPDKADGVCPGQCICGPYETPCPIGVC